MNDTKNRMKDTQNREKSAPSGPPVDPGFGPAPFPHTGRRPDLPKGVKSEDQKKTEAEAAQRIELRKKGLICPNRACLSSRVQVLRTWDTKEGRVRARKCNKCGHEYQTTETIAAEDVQKQKS